MDDQEKRMAQYLLGQLTEQQEVELERGYLADDAVFEELLAIEDDLRDAYRRGELSKPDRDAFERRLLSAPAQKQKQDFARSLRRHLNEAVARRRPDTGLPKHDKWLFRILNGRRLVLVPALSMTLIVLIAAGLWLGHRRMQPLQSRNTAAGTSPTAHESSHPEAKTIAFVLTPGSVRSTEGESNILVIPRGVSEVRLEAIFKGDYAQYQASVETVEGRSIWNQGDLVAEAFSGSKRIFMYLPTKSLPPNDYILTLRGVPASGSPKTVAEYNFRVQSKQEP